MPATALAPGPTSGQSDRVVNRSLGVALIAALASAVGCASKSSPESSTGDPAASVPVPADRSLEVSYNGDLIELSFARLGQPFRAMHAQVLTWSDDAWRYYGTLSTANANAVGALTTEAADAVPLLDGTNFGPQRDGYRAPGLPSGRYLICTTTVEFVEPASSSEVCGELDIT